MAINRGKDFEKEFKKLFLEESNIALERLYDSTSGFAGIKTKCDFIVYRYPNQYYFELKSIHKTSFPLSSISDNQRRGLTSVSDITGICAGVVIWFCDHDITAYVPIQEINRWEKDSGKKSIGVKDIIENKINHVILKGIKKRALMSYSDVNGFLENIRNINLN